MHRLTFGRNVLILASAVALAAQLGCKESKPPAAVPKQTLRIGYSPLALNAPLFVALERHYFAGPVETIPFRSTNDLLTAVVAGRVDVASAVTTESVLQIHARYPNTLKTILYNAFTPKTRADAIVVALDSPLKSCEGLTGDVGAYPAQSIVTYLDMTFGKKIHVVQIPPTSIIEALAHHSVGAAYLLEPQITVATARKSARVVCWAPLTTPQQKTLLVGSHVVNPQSSSARGWTADEVAAIFARAAAESQNAAVPRGAIVKYTNLPEPIAQNVQFPEWLTPSADTLRVLRSTCDAFFSRGVVTACKNLEGTELQKAR
jgi:hypothetical protein